MNGRDRLSDLFELKERAEEDVFFARRDRELMARIKRANEEDHQDIVEELARFRCPQCGRRLRQRSFHGSNINVCPACHGAWLSNEKLRRLTEGKAESWAHEFLSGLMHLIEHPYG